MLDLDAIHDIVVAADTGRIEKAQELRRRFEAEMRLLDDLGWTRKISHESFEITLPPATLGVVIEGLHRRYLDALTRLAEGATQDEAGTAEENATALASLARLAVEALAPGESSSEPAVASAGHL